MLKFLVHSSTKLTRQSLLKKNGKEIIVSYVKSFQSNLII